MPIQYNRLVDKQPTSGRHATASKVLPGHVPSSVQVGVQLKPAFPANKPGLRLSIVPIREFTARTALAGVSRVNPNNTATGLLRLVLQKASQLGKTPRMHSASRLTTALFNASANIGEIFHHNSVAGIYGLNDAFRKNMIAITPETFDLSTQSTEMPPSRTGAFGLKITTQLEVPTLDGLPSAFTKELVVACDSRTIQPKVYTDHLIGKRHFRSGNGYNQVQPKFATLKNQIRAVEPSGFFQPSCSIRICRKHDWKPTAHSGKANGAFLDARAIASRVIANRQKFSTRLRCAAPLFLSCQSRFDSLRSPDATGAHQLRRKIGELRTEIPISFPVQRYAVSYTTGPAKFRNGIETGRLLLNGFKQHGALLLRRPKTQFNRAIHRSCTISFCQTSQPTRGIEPLAGSPFPLPPEGGSLQGDY